MLSRYFFLFLCSLLLAGCVAYNRSRSCDEIALAGMWSMFSEQTSVEQVTNWVIDTFHLSHQNVEVEPTYGRVVWEADGWQYSVVVDGRTLKGMHIAYNRMPPKGDEVVACVGAPEWYRAKAEKLAESYQLSVDLLYPSQGTWVHGAKLSFWQSAKSPAMNGDFPISTLNLVRPGLLERTFPSIFREPLQRWPGAWAEVVVETDSDFPAR